MRSKLLIAASSALLLGITLPAQQPAADPFADIKSLDCTFTTASSLTWAAGEPHFDLKRTAFRFQINDIETKEGSARFTLGAANTTIVASLGESTIHFIDRRAEGSMAMTSVFAEQRRQRKFRAVYSRTEYYAYDGPGFKSVPLVDQFYGYCEPLP